MLTLEHLKERSNYFYTMYQQTKHPDSKELWRKQHVYYEKLIEEKIKEMNNVCEQ